jgi:hypothetical protein
VLVHKPAKGDTRQANLTRCGGDAVQALPLDRRLGASQSESHDKFRPKSVALNRRGREPCGWRPLGFRTVTKTNLSSREHYNIFRDWPL